MTPAAFLVVALSAVCTVVANLCLRAGVLRAGGFVVSSNGLMSLSRQPFFIMGIVFYAMAALVWFRALSISQLTISYPVLVSLTFVLVTLGAAAFFQEPISWQKTVGLGIILTGMMVIARA